MPDITKCKNESCPLKEKCYRWTSKPSEFMQSYQEFEYTWEEESGEMIYAECDNFMEIR